MAKQRYYLDANESIILKASSVRHGFWGLYTNDLILTTDNIICVEQGVFGNHKTNNYYPLYKLKQAIIGKKVAVFCDSEFLHGYDWENKKNEIKTRRDFWIPKIERNMQRDVEVTESLQKDGWIVLRFWGKDIKKHLSDCVDQIENTLAER